VALSAALNFMAMRLPINIAGGSISLTMLPIAVIALRRGALIGATAGAVFGLLDLLMEPYILVPAQVALDYPVPYLLFGLGVGLFSAYRKAASGVAGGGASAAAASGGASGNTAAARARTNPARIIAALLTGGTLRLVSHLLSGVLFFAEYAGGQNVWLYSLTYNVSYVAPSLIASAVCALVLMPILDRSVPVQPKG
jgi:thiamine transporter